MKLINYLGETIVGLGILAYITIWFTALFAGIPILIVEFVIPLIHNTFAG